MPDLASKSGWRTYRFDQMAVMINDRIDDPSEADVEYYVGLEHLDSDSLTIRRWGVPSDVEATKLRFRAGDIIFGRRRVYQRKLAVAHFDGICSAHAMVLRAKPEVVTPEFLPFFMQSDLFMERAKKISVGSLSPTINWKTLAQEEFALPPLEEQRRFAVILQATEVARQRYGGAGEALTTVLTSWLDTRLGRGQPVRRLGDVLLSTEYGSSTHANTDHQGAPILRIPNVLRGELDLSDLKWVRLSDDETAKYLLHSGDILMVRTNGNPEYVGRCLVVPQLPEATVFASYLIRLVVDSSMARPEYVANLLNSPDIRRQLRRSVRSSAGNFNINTAGIRGVHVPVPPLSEQDAALRELAALDVARSRCQERKCELEAIRQLIIGGLQQ